MKVKALTDAAVERNSAAQDRYALNVMRQAETLQNFLMRETDSLIEQGRDLDRARSNYLVSVEITQAIIRDDIPTLARILDTRGNV